MSQQHTRGKHETEPIGFECLPEDILLQIVKPLGLYDKIRLQLVSRKLHALLLSPPPGEGLWGEFDMSYHFHRPTFHMRDCKMGLRSYDLSKDFDWRSLLCPYAEGWLHKRVPHMTRVRCITHTEEGAWMVRGILPELSGLLAPGAELAIDLNAKCTAELLYCEAGKPNKGLLDFWHKMSGCLTELEIDADLVEADLQLQPQLFKQLTALTKLTMLGCSMSLEMDLLGGGVLNSPNLRSLCVCEYQGERNLVLEWPRLTSLTLDSCEGPGLVLLQAPLEHLYARFSKAFMMHAGFPLTNFLGLVSLSINCHKDGEEVLFSALPLMKKLHTLDLVVHQGWLLRSLPQRLCKVALVYPSGAGWDDRIIPGLQQLSELKSLEIKVHRYNDRDTLSALSTDLRPFMAMEQLCTLQLGLRQAWTPDSLRALGQFETELARSGSKLKLAITY